VRSAGDLAKAAPVRIRSTASADFDEAGIGVCASVQCIHMTSFALIEGILEIYIRNSQAKPVTFSRKSQKNLNRGGDGALSLLAEP
jgi:hypothetical protein